MSALDEARKEKVMNAMEHTKAFIAAVAEFDADQVRAAAEVRARPRPIVPDASNPRRRFPPRRRAPSRERLDSTADPAPPAQLFKERTGGSVAGLGDSNGRTPLHMVRAPRPDDRRRRPARHPPKSQRA